MSEMNSNQQSGSAAVELAPQLREHLHLKEAVCLELEKLPGTEVEDYQGAILQLQEKFNALPEVAPEYAEILNKRFQNAVDAANRAADEVAERKARREEKNQEAKMLRKELDALIAAGELVTLSEVEKLGKRWEACIALADPAAVDADEFKSLFLPLMERLKAEAAVEQQNADAAVSLGEELKALLDYDDFNFIQQRKSAVEAKFAELGAIPRAAFDRYNEQHKAVAAKLAQHYQTLDFARWESYTLKMDLCSDLEKLQDAADNELAKVARTLRELREKWKTLGAVPKEKNEEINNRYLELTRNLQHRVDEYYAKVRQEQKAAAEAKKALCEQVAALQDSTEWNKTAEAFKQAQAEWKKVPHAGNVEKNLYAQFRASADHFFAARSAYFAEKNKRSEAVAEVKKLLIEAAESLDLAQGEAAVRRAKQLRSEFREAGLAGKQEKELAARFDAALEKFFAGRREQFNEKENKVRSLLGELEALTGTITDPAAADARSRAIRNEIAELNCRNLRGEEEKIFAAFSKALNAARRKMLTDKYAVYCEIAPAAAAAVDAVLAGEVPGDVCAEQTALFAKLQQIMQLVQAASSGDVKSADKLKRMRENARNELERIVSLLEDTVGIKSESAVQDETSLAAELQAAIFGNSGFGSSVKSETKTVDPKLLLNDLFNAGVASAGDTAGFIERFRTAYGKLR